jgi:hypothetical protein
VKLTLSVVLGISAAVVGFLAQRSRMCFVAGLRDWFLVRDRELLLGLFTFVITIWFLTSLFSQLHLLRRGIPEYGEIEAARSVMGVSRSLMKLGKVTILERGVIESLSPRTNPFVIATFGGGLFLGLISTITGGCVLRQHVLCAQGNRDALFYILGFYFAVIVYYNLLFRFIVRVY